MAVLRKLSTDEISAALRGLSDWSRDGDHIVREVRFGDFDQAMVFVNRVADVARAHDHHPELYNVYNRVTLRMTTHDAGGITERDIRFAVAVNALL